MSATTYDAIVIGAGHNGMVCAAYLAKAGRKVLVLEQRAVVGGIAAVDESIPGFYLPVAAVNAGGFDPGIISDLQLDRYGLDFIPSTAAATALLPENELLTLWNDEIRSQEEIGRFSSHDAEIFPAYLEATIQFSRVISHLAKLPPPDLFNLKSASIFPWLKAVLKVRALGSRSMMEFLRALPLSAQEYLDEWFENESLRGLLAFPSVAGTMQGPRATGTALQLLYQHMGASRAGYRALKFVRGGMGAFSQALQEAAQSHGAEIICDAPVARILTKAHECVGVELESGDRFHSKVVISNADPRRTLFGLLEPILLEPRTVRRIRNIKFKGSTAKVNLALSRLPDSIASHAEQERFFGHITLSPSIDHLERAYDDAKYGRISKALAMEMVIPTLLDPSLAPDGQHILSIDVRYAPYKLREGSWEGEKEHLLENTVSQLSAHFPDIDACVLHSQAITPLEYERDLGLTEGSLYHGQMGLDQLLFMRPIPGHADYRAPVGNLYLCGSGTHPGGGVNGLPGRNAARQILKKN